VTSREPLLIPSGQVNASWLMLVMPPPLFGGDFQPDLSLLPHDCRMVRLDQLGNDVTGGLS